MKALEFDPPLINTVHAHTLTHVLSHDLWTSLWIQFPAHSRRKVYRDQSCFIVSKIITCAQFQLLLVLDDKRSWQSSEDSPVPPSFFTPTFDTLSLIILGHKWSDHISRNEGKTQSWCQQALNRPKSIHWQPLECSLPKRKRLRHVVLITECEMDHNFLSWILLLFGGFTWVSLHWM